MDIHHEIPASKSAGAEARHILDGWLTDLVGDDTANAARLAATELVANAVQHGQLQPDETIRLAGVATEEVVRVEVEQSTPITDAHVVVPGEREATEGGFGLRIVEKLSANWGVRAAAPGTVWFEVERDAREAAPPDGI